MQNKIEETINQAVQNMIKKTSNNSKINKLILKHNAKIHFIPQKYRVFGGLLQSMNIQFGNFIEELMALLISEDRRYEIIKKYSGKKSNTFKISVSNERTIDNYITKCQTEDSDFLDINFINLINNIIADNNKETILFKHDIDLLFKNKENGVIYYLEIKYNDDHDTGKFVDINRKFIKTSAYLIDELNITEFGQFKPILFFFNNKKMKGNIYVPENLNIYRGKRFFDEFLNVDYNDVEKYMSELSENHETIEVFNTLYNQIMNM